MNGCFKGKYKITSPYGNRVSNGKTADVSNDITVPIGANVAVYKCYGEAKATSYIYHNGGFVEL